MRIRTTLSRKGEVGEAGMATGASRTGNPPTNPKTMAEGTVAVRSISPAGKVAIMASETSALGRHSGEVAVAVGAAEMAATVGQAVLEHQMRMSMPVPETRRGMVVEEAAGVEVARPHR